MGTCGHETFITLGATPPAPCMIFEYSIYSNRSNGELYYISGSYTSTITVLAFFLQTLQLQGLAREKILSFEGKELSARGVLSTAVATALNSPNNASNGVVSQAVAFQQSLDQWSGL